MANATVVLILVLIFVPTLWVAKEVFVDRHEDREGENWGWGALVVLFWYLLASVILFLLTDHRGWFFLPLLPSIAVFFCGFKDDHYYYEQVEKRQRKRSMKSSR